MHDVDHLDARRRDPIENDIIRMRHNLAHPWNALARLEKVRMLRRMLKIVLYPIKKTLCGLFVMFADRFQNPQ